MVELLTSARFEGVVVMANAVSGWSAPTMTELPNLAHRRGRKIAPHPAMRFIARWGVNCFKLGQREAYAAEAKKHRAAKEERNDRR